MRTRAIFISLLTLLILTLPSVEAAAYENIEVIAQYPAEQENIGFIVSNECSGHSCFNQVYIRSDGWFATYTNFSQDALSSGDSPYGKVYIDVYNADAQLQFEISVNTTENVGIILLDDTVEIYLYSSLLSYNWEKDKLNAYLIPAHALHDSGLYNELHKANFQIGEWTYHCKTGFPGYTRLTRENGSEKQVLLSYTGFQVGGVSVSPMVIGVSAGVIAVLLSMLVKKYKKKNK